MYKIFEPAEKIRIINVETKGFKTGEITVSMAVPMSENPAPNALMINMLKRSCKRYPDFTSFNAKCDELYGALVGGSVSKIGDCQVLELFGTGLDNKFALTDEKIAEECAQLISDLIFEPNITNDKKGIESLELEKRLLISKINDENDDKRIYSRKKCIEMLCENEIYALSRYGTPEQINAVTIEDVCNALKAVLETAQIQITVIGSMDFDFLCKVFTDRFNMINRKPCALKTDFNPDVSCVKEKEEKIPVNQGKLVMGYRTGKRFSRDRLCEYMVTNDIFGGGTYSYLFTVIREKMSLAYYCRSTNISAKGLLLVEAGIDSDKKQNVIDGVTELLEKLKTQEVTDELLENSKKSIRENLTFTSPDAYTSWYEGQVIFDKVISPEEVIDGVEKVTKEQIMKCADEIKLSSIFMLSQEEENAD